MLLRRYALQKIGTDTGIRTFRTSTVLENKAQSSLVPSAAIKPKTEMPLSRSNQLKRPTRPKPPKSFSSQFLDVTSMVILTGIGGAIGIGTVIAMGSLAVFTFGASLELGFLMLEKAFSPKKNSEKAALEPPKRNSEIVPKP